MTLTQDRAQVLGRVCPRHATTSLPMPAPSSPDASCRPEALRRTWVRRDLHGVIWVVNGPERTHSFESRWRISTLDGQAGALRSPMPNLCRRR